MAHLWTLTLACSAQCAGSSHRSSWCFVWSDHRAIMCVSMQGEKSVLIKLQPKPGVCVWLGDASLLSKLVCVCVAASSPQQALTFTVQLLNTHPISAPATSTSAASRLGDNRGSACPQRRPVFISNSMLTRQAAQKGEEMKTHELHTSWTKKDAAVCILTLCPWAAHDIQYCAHLNAAILCVFKLWHSHSIPKVHYSIFVCVVVVFILWSCAHRLNTLLLSEYFRLIDWLC